MIVKTKNLCELFECNKSSITLWGRLGLGEARKGRDQWDLKPAWLWWIENIYTGTKNDPPDESLAEARRLYWKARAEHERLKVDQERGELIPREEIGQQWAARVGEVCSGLDYFQSRIVSLMPDSIRAEISIKIKAEIRALREAYSRGGRYCPQPEKHP